MVLPRVCKRKISKAIFFEKEGIIDWITAQSVTRFYRCCIDVDVTNSGFVVVEMEGDIGCMYGP